MKYIFIFLISFSLYGQSAEQIKNQIKSSGLSKQQLKNVARDQGIDSEQIKSELNSSGIELDNNLNGAPAKEPKSVINEIDQLDEENSLDDINEEEIISESITNSGNSNLDYFGYKIFKGDPDAFQSSNYGAVDPNYNIGPGDQIIVMLWGESQFRQEFLIDREGYVFVPEVGQIFVNGLNLEDLEKKLFQIFSKVYSTLNPAIGNPSTFIDISIGNLRPLRIIVLGEVAQPGAYSINPSTSLSSSLYYFNGPTTSGSLRDIRLIRKGKEIGEIDFYKYLLSGNIPNDIRLQMDDVVFIPGRGKTVSIYGQITRPGIYELNSSEGLNDLIDIAGGLSVNAYTNRIQINRIVPKDNRSSIGMDRMLIDISFNELINKNEKINIVDGDIIEILSIEENQKNFVTLIGSSIARPGKYQLIEGMKVNDLINKSDGILNDAYLDIAHIKRITDNLSTKLITINLKKAIEGQNEHNLVLKYFDELIIYNNNEINNLFQNVYIDGPVKKPGMYFLDKEKSLTDLIIKSGGFSKNVSQVRITIARNIKNKNYPVLFSFPEKDSNQFIDVLSINSLDSPLKSFYLEKNDVINIYSFQNDDLPELVKIDGAINLPGWYPILSSDEKVSDVIDRAGGLTENAYPIASTFKRNSRLIKLSFKDIIKNPKSRENLLLMNNDEIFISKRMNMVQVLGEVNQPGFYKNYKGYSVKDFIDICGGLNSNADKDQIWITYPNGISKHYKGIIFPPKVLDGSVITIGTVKESEPLDKTEFAKEIASIFADFLQIFLTLSFIINSNNNSN